MSSPCRTPTRSSESDVTDKKQIGDNVFLHTVSHSPTYFKYAVEAVGFRVIKLKLDFTGSVNFEVVGYGAVPGKPLHAELEAGPNEKSKEVMIRLVFKLFFFTRY